jgi:homotetrameric cytidine deaminase
VPVTDPLDALRACAGEAAEHAHVPYSRRPAGAAVLLADGSWIPGARIENASFPLTIPAATAALAIARVAGRAGDVRAVAVSRPFEAGEAEALAASVAEALQPQGLTLTQAAADVLATAGPLPYPASALPLELDARPPAGDAEGAALAARVAERAHVPESAFPVGCVVLAADGRLYTGANVEQADWTRGLCAERVALATAVAAGAMPARRIWVACASGPGCTPCGACRQVISELAPAADVVMAGGTVGLDVMSATNLLPGAFDGTQLGRGDH